MPAGRLVKYVPKTRKRRSGFRKAVARIARKVVRGQAETKTGSLSISQNFGTNGALHDLWTTMALGVNQNQRIGDQVRALGVKIRGVLAMDTTIITGLQDANSIRFMVVSSKRPLVLADLPGWNGGTDPELYTVLHDRYINFATNKRYVYFQKYIKYNRKLDWDSSGVQTNNHMYIYAVPYGGTGLLAGSGDQMNLNVQRYYKDI